MTTQKEGKIVLLGLDKARIAELLPDCPKFTASQIYGFLMDGKDFDEMTSLKRNCARSLKSDLLQIPCVFCTSIKANRAHKSFCLGWKTTIS